MKKVYFFEFWNCTPHLETSLELAKKHLDAGDEVHYHFCGHDALYQERLSLAASNRMVRLGLAQLPECRGAALLESPPFHFYPRTAFAPVNWQAPDTPWTPESLTAFNWQGYEGGLAAYSSLVTLTGSAMPDLAYYHEQVNTMLRSGMQVYAGVRAMLAQQKPDLVYVFNGRFCNYRAVMNAAQACNVHYLLHERGANMHRYYLQPYMPHDTHRMQAEMLAAWQQVAGDPHARQVAEAFFVDRRRGKDQGWVSFTREQQAGSLPPLDKSKRTLAYFSSSDDEYVAVGDIYKWEGWRDQFDAVNNLIELCRQQGDIQLVMRLHPHLAKKPAADRDRWLGFQAQPGITVIPPESAIDTYALIEAADLVVTAGSTVGIEAVYWGRPSITLGPSLYSDFGATFEPRSEAELHTLLASPHLTVDPARALAYGYFMSTFGHEFVYYEPDSLFSGKFLGVNLQTLPWLACWARKVNGMLRVARAGR